MLMKEIKFNELHLISGGMNLDGHRESGNIIDQRGRDMGTYIDANGRCWAPGTSSIDMYPNGGGTSWGSGPWQPSSGGSFSLEDILIIGWNRFQRDVWGH